MEALTIATDTLESITTCNSFLGLHITQVKQIIHASMHE